MPMASLGPVTVGYNNPNRLLRSPLFIGQSLGYFEEVDIEIEEVHAAGSFDLSLFDSDVLFDAEDKSPQAGEPLGLRMLNINLGGQPIIMGSNADIPDAEALRGKRVGGAREGTTNEGLAKFILQELGLDWETDVDNDNATPFSGGSRVVPEGKLTPRQLRVAAVLMADLAFGENSEIYKDLVIREQKVQFVRAAVDFNRDPKLYDVYGQVKDEADIDYVLDRMNKTIETFQVELVSEEDLENTKKRRSYGYLMRLETPNDVGSRLERPLALPGGIEAIDALYATMAKITPEDIRQAAIKYYQPERRTVLVLKGGKKS